MNDKSFSWKNFNKAPVVGILRGLSSIDSVKKLAEIYLDSGFYTIEITMNTENVHNIIAALSKEFPELNVGAGTVCTISQYKKVIDHGAQFIVSPIVNEDVILNAVSDRIPIFPGAYTPTEIYNAWNLGADAVKVFPATKLGPSYIKDVLAPLDNLKLIPTAGVSIHNIKSFFKVGAFGVGMGSNLVNYEDIRQKNYQSIQSHLLNIKHEIEEYCQ